MDCGGTCVESGSDVAAWLGDGYCDDGAYGYFFNCPALGCDGGDCSAAECSMGDPGEVCMFGLFGGDDGDEYWIFGDVFLRTVRAKQARVDEWRRLRGCAWWQGWGFRLFRCGLL
jgi:hypothetical protein